MSNQKTEEKYTYQATKEKWNSNISENNSNFREAQNTMATRTRSNKVKIFPAETFKVNKQDKLEVQIENNLNNIQPEKKSKICNLIFLGSMKVIETNTKKITNIDDGITESDDNSEYPILEKKGKVNFTHRT